VTGSLWLLEVTTRELMLFAAVGLLIGGIDDLAVDLLFFARRAWRGFGVPVALGDLAEVPDSRVAIFVPAWREEAVIGAMLRTLLARLSGDYTVYVVAYCNDRATMMAVDAVARADPRVRLVVNTDPGPSTKADNLNAAWAAMRAADAENGATTRFVVLHDAEDVVHADELRVFDALIGDYDVVQLPVRPLVRRGIRLVAGTYSDSFAESHAKTMVIRTALGASMPLAGVGCAIRTDALAAIARARGGAPFDPTSLVEDYEIGLWLSELRFRSAFARVPDGTRRGVVATGEYFPDTLGAAVKQKARWMAGIALAGWDRTGWSRHGGVLDVWMRMRDRRALIGMFILAAAYVSAVLYAIVLIAQDVSGIVPSVVISPPAALLGCNVALLVWRMMMRVGCTWRVYGAWEAALAPVRFFIGNAIDLAASVLALRRYVATLNGAPPVWDKTEHEFPADVQTG
jgi:adsorption protein B